MTNTSEALPKTSALADVATDEDKLFHDGYVKGIAEFIKSCATPMTIAIQGDWGTGKTSLMRLIEAKLRQEAKSLEAEATKAQKYDKDIIGVVTFDVWQQFGANPNVNLSEVLLGEMVAKLSGVDIATIKGISGFASAVSQAVGTVVATQATEAEDESPLGFILSWLLGSDESETSKKQEEEDTVSAADVQAFQTEFLNALKQLAEENGKSETSRLVVFVDGLDHIDSKATVDFMEQIKTYLDCPRCVFVLSVDEKTVFDGVSKKLGDKTDEGRKKLYFDRLVQVPFRIPSSAYNLDKYVMDLLEGKEELSDEFAAVIDILLKEPTLRCIKRCVNTMYLYQNVFESAETMQDDSLAMLLAAVVLQVESPRGFAMVAECAEGGDEGFDESLTAALESAKLNDGINWTMLPALWQDKESGGIDATQRSAFLSWIRKMK